MSVMIFQVCTDPKTRYTSHSDIYVDLADFACELHSGRTFNKTYVIARVHPFYGVSFYEYKGCKDGSVHFVQELKTNDQLRRAINATFKP